MKSIEEIAEEMGHFWIGREREKAKRIYGRIKDKDLTRTEYVNLSIRHAYASFKQHETEVDRAGAD